VEVILADVIDAYFDTARQQQQLEVLREAVSLSQERVRIAQMRRDVGTASDLDVRQARVDLNADSADVLRQNVALAAARATLFRLLGKRRPPDDLAVSARISIDETLSFQELLETTRARSPALRQATAALQSARAEERELRAEYFPALDAVVGYGYNRFAGGTGFLETSESLNLSYGLSLTFNVFDGLNRERRQQNATLRTRNAELLINDIEAELQAALQRAFSSYRNRLDIVVLERENLEVAASNVDLALERFRLGTITSVELRDVQEQRIRAASDLLTARFDAKRAETELLRLSGQLFERATP
jgi:outer membrane protein TolC